MPAPTMFLDRDGIINVDFGYVHSVERLEWIEGAREAICFANSAGFKVIVVTNQAGIGRGYYTEAEMHNFHEHLETEVSKEGGRIDAFYHCPFHEDAVIDAFKVGNHPDRKPNPGMILRAIADHNVDTNHAFLVGDKRSDVVAAERANIPGYLYEGGSLLKLVETLIQRHNLD